jgi:hypothetical protein
METVQIIGQLCGDGTVARNNNDLKNALAGGIV